MKIPKITWAGLYLAAFTLPLWSQNAKQTSVGIPGYLDARTGAFQPMPQALPEIDPATISPVTGKIVVNLTITISSSIPTTDVISCGVTATVLDVASQLSFIDSALVAATRKGTTATCTVDVPYSWALTSASSDMVQIEYEILTPATATGAPLPSRTAEHGLANIHVPSSGATTTYNPATTI